MDKISDFFSPILQAIRENAEQRPEALAILVALVAFFVWRHHRKKKRAQAAPAHTPRPAAAPAEEEEEEDEEEYGDAYEVLSAAKFRRVSSAFVAFDLETTGLSEYSDRIIEIGAARVRSGRIVATFSELVRADVPNGAENVNHITPAMLRKARPIEKVLPDFLAFVGDDPIAAHNARFDYDFLSRACRDCGLKPPTRVFNTFCLCSVWGTKDKKLATLLETCGIVNTNPHRALGDAEALAKAIVASIPRIPDTEMQARRAHSTEQVEAVDDRVKGLRFVLTGDVPGMDRAQVERLIRLHGGRCTGSISGVTDYLVEGEYPEEGPGFVSGKKRAALEAQAQGGKIRIIPYAKLFEMIGEDSP